VVTPSGSAVSQIHVAMKKTCNFQPISCHILETMGTRLLCNVNRKLCVIYQKIRLLTLSDMSFSVTGNRPGANAAYITDKVNYYWLANGPELFCSLASVVVICNAAGGVPPGAWAVGRPTLHGRPVRLRHVRATSC